MGSRPLNVSSPELKFLIQTKVLLQHMGSRLLNVSSPELKFLFQTKVFYGFVYLQHMEMTTRYMVVCRIWGRNSSIGIATRLQAVWPSRRFILIKAKPHSVLHNWYRGAVSLYMKRLGGESDHSPLPSVEVKVKRKINSVAWVHEANYTGRATAACQRS
jgi:hypothetical protein